MVRMRPLPAALLAMVLAGGDPVAAQQPVPHQPPAALQQPASQPPTAAQPPLPNGANALQETYEDWTVACGVTQVGKQCSLSQQQTQDDGQRVLAIEVTAAPGGGISGALVLPFGLALVDGAALQVDDQTAQSLLAFSTCVPDGCVAPLSLDAAQVDTLRHGKQLKVNVRALGEPDLTTLTISLHGFAAALDRVRALVG